MLAELLGDISAVVLASIILITVQIIMELREIESLGFECTPPAKPSPNPLESLFSQDEITLLELMSIQNLPTLVKETSQSFSKKLLNHHQLIKDIIDCALRPNKLQIPQLDVAWPFLAAEFLSHQEEEFYKSFFNSAKSAKSEETHSDSGSRIEGSELLEWLFKILEQPKPINNTSAGYLLRIFNQIYYANQQEFFWYFVNNQQTLASCVEHLYNPSILEIIWRIVDTYNEDIDNKVGIINKVLKGGMVVGPFTLENLENIQFLVENLIQRSEEINTKKLSIRLCREVICKQNIDLIRKLLCSSDASSIDGKILNQCTILLNTYLKFFIQQKNPKKEAFKMQSSIEFVTITDQLLDQIILLVRCLFHLWFKSPKQQNKLSKYTPIALLHSVLKLKPMAAEQLIFEPFVGLCINLMKDEEKNNIMHNEIKGVLELAFSTQAAQWIITPELLLFIAGCFSAQHPNQPPYLNQLFHISETIQEHINPSKINKQVLAKWNQFIQGKYKARKELYSTPLAKETPQRKNFFSEQSEVLSEEGDENGDVIILNKYSQEDLPFPAFQKIKSTSPPPEFQQIQMRMPANIMDSGQLEGESGQEKEPAEQQRDAQEGVEGTEQ